LADIEVFVFAVEAELEAMDRERVGVHRRGRKPDLALRRRLIGLIWTLTFGGLQWRVAGWLSGVPFTTLHSTFARWTRLGLWRRLGQRLALFTDCVTMDARGMLDACAERGIEAVLLMLWPDFQNPP
jgi:hypothetical protein